MGSVMFNYLSLLLLRDRHCCILLVSIIEGRAPPFWIDDCRLSIVDWFFSIINRPSSIVNHQGGVHLDLHTYLYSKPFTVITDQIGNKIVKKKIIYLHLWVVAKNLKGF
jgi:hypothetical protein